MYNIIIIINIIINSKELKSLKLNSTCLTWDMWDL